jgi:hypothetical protein
VARVAAAQTAKEWTAGPTGWTPFIGPRGVIGIDGSVLVDGFEHRPAIGIPWNYPYYDAFIKDSGFEKDTDYLSGYARGDHEIPPRLYDIAARVKEKRGFWIKTFQSRAEIREWIPRALEIHRQAMSGLHTYFPPTEAETRERHQFVADHRRSVADQVGHEESRQRLRRHRRLHHRLS